MKGASLKTNAIASFIFLKKKSAFYRSIYEIQEANIYFKKQIVIFFFYL